MVKQVFKKWAKRSFITPIVEKMKIKNKMEELKKIIEHLKVIVQIQKDELNIQFCYQNVLRREGEFWCIESCNLCLQVED